jgi:hypothetical protein
VLGKQGGVGSPGIVQRIGQFFFREDGRGSSPRCHFLGKPAGARHVREGSA